MTLLSLGLQDIGWAERKTAETISLDTLIRRLEVVYATVSGISVTPENCMESPTVAAVVRAMCKLVISSPVHVFRKSMTSEGRTTKELLPNHPVEKLLAQPNEWQSATDYWQDATSVFLRYQRYFAFKARGVTGPIRRLLPLQTSACTPKQDDDYNVVVEVMQASGKPETYTLSQLHYVRGPARDFLKGDSPITDCREAIALEIAAEKFGASFFGGGAMPGIVFELMEGFSGYKTKEEKDNFLRDFQERYGAGNGKRFTAAMLPKGIKMSDKMIGFENDKAQFLETRKLQRTIIAALLGVPVYLTGDLERQTFNNAEQQSINKVTEAGLPIVKTFESAMERDLLTVDDRNSGVIIRFNLDGLLRGDFKTRQDGLKIQREAGVINADEWREVEGMNPRTDPGGETYWDTGPSGQGMKPAQQPGGANANPNA